MNSFISNYIRYHPIRTQRGLEILTGLIPWSIILFPLIGSFFIPEMVAYFVIAFNVYWLYRSIQMVIFAFIGYLNIKGTQKIDWEQKLPKDLPVNVVIISIVKEPLEIIERNLDSLKAQSFPQKKIVVVLGMEDRVGQEAYGRAKILLKKYKNKFGLITTTFHKLMPGETIGKHSNEAFAAKAIKKILVDKKKISLNKIILTTADADCVFPPQYLSLLTYKFLHDKNRYQCFYQAPLFMYNNLHRVPLLVRIPSIVSGIYFLSILQKYSRRFLNYSTYSLSLKLLDQVGYWDLDVIPEDAHLYFKSYFALRGEVTVVPLFLPIYIDAAESTSLWRTYKNSYEQNKRWAWGVVDIPYVIKNFFLHPEIPAWEKLVKISLVIEWHFVWSSFWFLLTLGATIPTIVNPVFARTALGLNLSRVSSSILTLCTIGILTIIFLDAFLNPKTKLRSLFHPFTYLQWLFLPITGFIFGSLPGLESQTRLMLGKYLKYHVTEKVVS